MLPTDEALHMYDCALCFWVFRQQHPEAEYFYRELFNQDPDPNYQEILQNFRANHEPAPVIATIEKTYRKLRYLATPEKGCNWN